MKCKSNFEGVIKDKSFEKGHVNLQQIQMNSEKFQKKMFRRIKKITEAMFVKESREFCTNALEVRTICEN